MTLADFLLAAQSDASARCGDPFRSPLERAMADAEVAVIEQLQTLIYTDDEARAFVSRWRHLVQHAPSQYPRLRGATLPSNESDTMQWTLGEPALEAAVTLWDAFVSDVGIIQYRTLGQFDNAD